MRRLLYISHRLPYPPDKGERVRAFHEIEALAGRFRVTLASVAHRRSDHAAAGPLRSICEKVLLGRGGGRRGLMRGAWSAVRGRSVTEGYFHSAALRRRLLEEAGRERIDLVVAYCSSVLPLALSVPAAARVVDLVDVDSAKWDAYAAEAAWPKRWALAREGRTVGRLERRAVEDCEAVVLVSEEEAGLLGREGANVMAVGNGVDSGYFAPGAVAPARCDGRALVFTGTMSYRPNEQAMRWFATEVWPGLKAEADDLELWIVGREPTPSVRSLAAMPGVRVTGSVADVRPYLEAAAMSICPLRTARGVQNKVLEAMAMGKAVVASPDSIVGLDVECGRDVFAAEAAGQWRATILRLLADSSERAAAGAAARQRVLDRYTWAGRMAPLVDLCERLAGGPDEPSPVRPREADATAGGGR
jgi:sugar transferase (PEP-CTERM/EpsH1 system associated)